jgi:hypothetical protein
MLGTILLAGGDARATELTELSLEELLQTQLDAMGITSIHHTHEKGEWMLQYHYMRMGMDGNLDGTSGRSTADVLAQYPVSPTSMDMEMHMVHVMHAPTERLTLMGMIPYVRLTMDHETRMGTSFTTDSEGLGDIKLAALFSAWRNERHRVVTEFGTSFPTGSIDEKDNTPMGFVRLPYPMQLGSGTFDILPAVTYLGQAESWAWGARVDGNLRTGRNDNDYRLGHRFGTSAWLARKLLPFASASIRLDGQLWGNISGADPQLNPRLVPTADPDLRAGRRLDILLGLNLFQTDGPLAGNRIGIEGGVPIYQRLDGPQLETDYRVSVSWDWTF